MKLMAGILVALGNLASACPDIEQIDINPLVVYQVCPKAAPMMTTLGLVFSKQNPLSSACFAI